ncbi:serine/threonine-protein kinase, partial [Singulisphaera rosea]
MIGVGATLNERFVLETELGQGGMGTVYRATDRVLGRTVAIKLLKDRGDEEVAEKLRLEAQILARLVHDKIVRLYDFGESEGTCFLVMEEVDGSVFASRWRFLPLEDRLRICGQVAEALDYAHRQGVIHRDVKPGNVLLTPSDAAKLSDFGLSVVLSEVGDVSGTIRGTPSYMSPEQAQGKSLDHRTDLYSVGVMLYECATGAVPFMGRVMSVIDQHIHAIPPDPRLKNPEISPTLEGLILSLLEKNPGKRPASGRITAIAIADEAERERVRRVGRTGPRFTGHSPPSREYVVGDGTPELTSTNGAARVEPRFESSETSTPVVAGDTRQHPEDPSRPSKGGPERASEGSSHPIAREMFAAMLATPVVVTPEERYLCGH